MIETSTVAESRPSFHDESLPLTAQDLWQVLDRMSEAERRQMPVRVTCGRAGTPRALLAAGLRESQGRQEFRMVVRSR